MDVKIYVNHLDRERGEAAHPGLKHPLYEELKQGGLSETEEDGRTKFDRLFDENKEAVEAFEVLLAPFFSQASIRTTAALLEECAKDFYLFAPVEEPKGYASMVDRALVYRSWGEPELRGHNVLYLPDDLELIVDVYEKHGEEIMDAGGPARRDLHDAIQHLVKPALEEGLPVQIQATRSNFVLAHG